MSERIRVSLNDPQDNPYAHLRVNQGKPCDCPARVLKESLIGTECEVCAGTVPPFDADQLRALAYEEQRAERIAAEELARWRRNGRK